MSLKDLTNETLISGIKKSYANAESLLSDAYTLGQSKKFPRAYTLCQLAIEEFAKVPLLFDLLMGRLTETRIDDEKYDKIFKDHTLKTEFSIETEISMFEYYKHKSGMKFVDNIIEKSPDYLDQARELNDLKNESLYIIIKNNDFQSPSEVISEDEYNSIMGTALLRQTMLQFFTKFNEKDIDKIKSALNKHT